MSTPTWDQLRKMTMREMDAAGLDHQEIADAFIRREQEDRAEANAQPIPPCPSWCREPSGHPYDASAEDGVSRDHSSNPGGPVELIETECNTSGRVTYPYPVAIFAWEGHGIEGERDPGASRAAAADLIRAADLLEEIQRSITAGGAL